MRKTVLLGGNPDKAAEEELDNLRQLYQLKESGVLSESEFNVKKWEILSCERFS